jgi:hypothetical protein
MNIHLHNRTVECRKDFYQPVGGGGGTENLIIKITFKLFNNIFTDLPRILRV